MVTAQLVANGFNRTTLPEEPDMVSFENEAKTSTSVEDAFCTMVEDYSDFAFNIAFRMLRRTEDAEDAVKQRFSARR